MSIIQDALKRKEEEERQGLHLRSEPSDPNAPPANPPPPSDPPAQPEPAKKEKHPWRAIVLVLLLVAIALIAGFYLLSTSLRGMKAPNDVPPREEARDPLITDEAEDAEDESTSEVDDSGVADAMDEVEPTPAAPESEDEDAVEEPVVPPSEEAPAPDPVDEPEPVNDSDPEIVDEPVVVDDAAAVEDDPDIAPEEPAPPVEWPRIQISGIMAPRAGAGGSVLIDSKLLSVGDTHRGVRVKSIAERSVELEYEGEVRTLFTGQSVGD